MAKLYPNDLSVLDAEFLSHDEIQDVLNKVFEMRELWVHRPPAPPKPEMYFLPVAQYATALPGVSAKYLESVIKNGPRFMEAFGVYYDRILSKVSEVFEVPAVFHERLAYPGFHIFEPGQGPLQHISDRFHLDGFYLDSSIGPMDTYSVYSLIIPLRLPKSGAGLTYIMNGQEKDFEYHPGELSMWDGNISHQIRHFTLEGADDYRITMQIHVAVQENLATVFW